MMLSAFGNSHFIKKTYEFVKWQYIEFCKIVSILLILLCLVFLFSCQTQNLTTPSTLRISSDRDPTTLDPRQARDLYTATMIYMLYEGLMRLDSDGNPILALAESFHISNDHKTYTFKLKKTYWTNGKLVTAHDFARSWKTILDPQFPSPNAYQFYPIKNAKAAKQGQVPLNQVGIQAKDDYTLIVELEHPTPYFLHLVSSYFYYPSSTETLEKNSYISPTQFVSNGPFKLEEWSPHDQIIVSKNPKYWDSKSVHLDQIIIMILDNTTSLALFDRGELDWTGSPLSTLPTDALATLREKNQLSITPAAGVFLIRFNTEKPPFNNVKLRQAFNLALNRQDLVEHVLQGNQVPAKGIIPHSLINHRTSLFRDFHLSRAQELFKEVLSEKHLDKEKLSPITLCYRTDERNHKIAQVIQEQWKQAFDIEINLQSCEGMLLKDKLEKFDYQIAIGSWFADIKDPISFLEVFKFKDNGTNHTQWENSQYIQLLNLSSQTTNAIEREKLLVEAESILIEETPIAPLFFGAYNYLKHPSVKGVYFSDLGYLDFKQARIEK